MSNKEESKNQAILSDTVNLNPDDCALIIRSEGSFDFAYNLANPEGKVPTSMLFANGLLSKLQDPKFIAELVNDGARAMSSAAKSSNAED